MADAVTFAGTQISISAGVPVTYDEAGFAALTYTSVGEVSSAPGDGGTTFEDVSYTVLGRRATVHLKGTSDQPEETMEVVVDRNDAGQIMLKAALLSDNQYAFKVVYNNGEIDYFQALVTGNAGEGGDSNTVRMRTVTFRRDYRDVVSIAGPGVTTVTLTYTAGANGSLIGASPQVIPLGTNGTAVAAVPAATYEFVQWSDGKLDNPRQDIGVMGNVTVTATFALA